MIGLLLEVNVRFGSHIQMAVFQIGIFQSMLEVRYIFHLCYAFDFGYAEMKAVGLVCAFDQFLRDVVCHIANALSLRSTTTISVPILGRCSA